MPLSLRLCREVKWRAFGDGLVVYVPATCETHLLSSALDSLFKPTVEEFSVIHSTGFESLHPQLVKELIDMKILESTS